MSFYKITDSQAKSCHGGSMDWAGYLPKYIHTEECINLASCPSDTCEKCKHQGKWRAGKWYKHDGELSMCNSGIHLTSEPFKWFKKNGRIFTVEYKGHVLSDNSDKCCFSKVRLLRECGYGDIIRIVSIWKGLASRADLSRANLSGADLSRVDLSRANLFRADLSRADLSRANLSRADLSRANLSEADLYEADLYGANLSRANLSRADLSGANLSRADLSGANLSGAWIDKDPHIKGYKFDNRRLWRETP